MKRRTEEDQAAQPTGKGKHAWGFDMEIFQKVQSRTLLADPIVNMLPLSLISFLYRIYKLKDTRAAHSIKAPNGIETLKKLNLGGVDQWIQIRGENINNPVLLVLHGGPGLPMMPLHSINASLEKHFTVVHWDHRGTGKSYHADMPETGMTLEQLIADTKALIEYLLDRFGQQKVYLVGFSWGSVIGLKTAARYPQLIERFIGVGQVANIRESEEISYRFVKAAAEKAQHHKAMHELAQIGQPPYCDHRGMIRERLWLIRFGGYFYKPPTGEGFNDFQFFKTAFNCPDYTLADITNAFKGVDFGARMFWPTLYNTNLMREEPRLECPVSFLLGRHDYVTPAEVAARYFEQLEAPAGKELVWFEHSAHWPLLEEPEKFHNVLVKLLEASGKRT